MGIDIRIKADTHRLNRGGFSPLSIDKDLRLWLRPDVGVTTVSGKISLWADQSGNSNDFYQNTADNRPTWTADELNGYGAAVPDNTNDFLTCDATVWARNCFLAVKRGDYAYGIAANDNYWLTIDQSASSIKGTSQLNFSFAAAYDNYMIEEIWCDTDNSDTYIWRNDTASTSNPLGASWVGFDQLFRRATTYYGSAKIVEVVAYYESLSSSERDQVRDYLNDKYSIY